MIASELWEVNLLQGPAMMLRTKLLHGIPASRKVWKRKLGGGLWDADHIIPVREGGGSCGLDNIQTLCIPCHKHKTHRR